MPTRSRAWSSLVAAFTALAFLLASTDAAVARTSPQDTLPEPVPLVLVEAPLAVTPPTPDAAMAAPAADLPVRVPAQQQATLGRVILVLLAIIAVVLLLAIAIVAYALWDLTH